jgi:outer membrane protein assembly factor BamB
MQSPIPTTASASEPRFAPLRRSLVATAWVAGVFITLVCAEMLYDHFTATANDPWKSPQLIALRNRLDTEPKNQQLKEQIRQSDVEFRRKFRRRLALDHLGGWLLAGGSLVLVVAARNAAELHRAVFLPQAERDRPGRLARAQSRARWSVVFTGGAAVLGLIALSLAIGTGLPASDADSRKLAGKSDAEKTAALPLPTLAELQANSPRFRGWDGSGRTTQTNYALSWDNQTGTGIAWKTPVLSPGHSSPVVWGNQVFISGGTADAREVFCHDAATGRLLWRRAIEKVPGSPPKTEVLEDTGYAASTTATDGRHLYVIFANGDLAALNFDGTVAWTKALGPLKNAYGHASSLTTWQGVLIVQLDQGEAGATNSRLLAFDGATGRALWSQPRPVPASWATPIVIEAAGKTQIITFAQPLVIAYAFVDGTELWRAELLENEVVPSPVFAGGLVIAACPSTKLIAIRPDGAGDVAKTQVAWSTDEAVPFITSPVSNGELIFTANESGAVACFDLKDGKKIWQHEFNLGVQASPALVGGKVFVMTEEGVAIVVEAGREFRENARSQLTDKFLASPAFANGRMFLRGETNLYCIGPTAAQPGNDYGSAKTKTGPLPANEK